jgi:hypothetical protein
MIIGKLIDMIILERLNLGYTDIDTLFKEVKGDTLEI